MPSPLYLPSGSSSDERQEAKFRFLDQFRPQLERLAREAEGPVVAMEYELWKGHVYRIRWRLDASFERPFTSSTET